MSETEKSEDEKPPEPKPEIERSNELCEMCRTPIPSDERGPEGELIRLQSGAPVCLQCHIDIEKLHRSEK